MKKQIPLPLLILGIVSITLTGAVTGWLIYILATERDPVVVEMPSKEMPPTPGPTAVPVAPQTTTTVMMEEANAQYEQIQAMKKNLDELITQERSRNEELERKITQLEALSEAAGVNTGAAAITELEAEIRERRAQTEALLAPRALTQQQEAQVEELLRAEREDAPDAE